MQKRVLRQLVHCPHCSRGPFEKFRGLPGHISKSENCARRQLDQLTQLRTAVSQTAHQRLELQAAGAERSAGTDDNVATGSWQRAAPNDDQEPPAADGAGWRERGSDAEQDPVDRSEDFQDREPFNPIGPWRYRARDPALEPFVGQYSGTAWEKMKQEERPDLPYHPWVSQEEFEVVNWLSREGMSQGAINRFLKLQYVSLTRLRVEDIN